jgi:hypothetical protein
VSASRGTLCPSHRDSSQDSLGEGICWLFCLWSHAGQKSHISTRVILNLLVLACGSESHSRVFFIISTCHIAARHHVGNVTFWDQGSGF